MLFNNLKITVFRYNYRCEGKLQILRSVKFYFYGDSNFFYHNEVESKKYERYQIVVSNISKSVKCISLSYYLFLFII